MFNLSSADILNAYANAGGSYWDVCDVDGFVADVFDAGLNHDNADAFLNDVVDMMLDAE